MERVRFWLLGTVICFTITNSLHALNSFVIPQVKTFYKHNYQASNRNWSIAHSKDGYLYIGNNSGLLCFDGYNWNTYTLPRYSKVRSVFVSSSDKVFTGSSEGIGYWSRSVTDSLVYHSLNNKVPNGLLGNKEIWRIFEMSNGHIIFQGFNLLLKFDGTQISEIQHETAPHLLVEFSSKLFSSSYGGKILELTNYGLINYVSSPLLPDVRITSMLPFKGKSALITSLKNGLYLTDNDKVERWNCEANEILKKAGINCAVYHNGYYYIGTVHSGIYILNEQGQIQYNINSENYLQDNTIQSLSFDKNNRLWFTMSVGLGYLELNTPISFIIDHKRKIGAIHDVAYFNNKLYLATNKGVYVKPHFKGDVLSSFDDFKPITTLKGLAWSLKLANNQLLCGHNNGTFLINKEGHITKISTIAGGRSFHELKVEDKLFLVQTSYKQLVVFEDSPTKGWQYKSVIEGFDDPTMKVTIDYKNQIWVLNNNQQELFRIRLQNNMKVPYRYNMYDDKNGLPNESKIQLFDYKKRVIITSTKGTYTYDGLNDSIVSYNKLNGYLKRFQNSKKIFQYRKDIFWLLKEREIALIQFKSKESKTLVNYSFNEPFVSLVENYENIVNLPNLGTVICLENGLGIVNDENLGEVSDNNNVYPLKVKLKYNLRDKEFLNIAEANSVINFPYKYENLTLDVASLSSPGKKLTTNCVIKGKQDSLFISQTVQQILIPKLKSGKYQIKILAKDSWGNSIQPYLLTINVLKPFWLSAQFIGLVFVLSIILIIFVAIRFSKNIQSVIHSKEYKKEIAILQNGAQTEVFEEEKRDMQQVISSQNNHIATEALNNIRNKEVLNTIMSELKAQKEKLGARYPDKYYSKIVDLIQSNIHTEDDWKVFEDHFDKANGMFVARLKKEFPNLTSRDVRLCAYLKMNLSSKEIAPLLGISERSVEVHRYRMRKKMDFPADINLADFMISF